MKRLMEGELTEAQAADKLGKGKGYLRRGYLSRAFRLHEN